MFKHLFQQGNLFKEEGYTNQIIRFSSSDVLTHTIFEAFGYEFVLDVSSFIRQDQVYYLIQRNQCVHILHKNRYGQWERDHEGATFRAAQEGEWLETEILKIDSPA